jgi:hypothetical protein
VNWKKFKISFSKMCRFKTALFIFCTASFFTATLSATPLSPCATLFDTQNYAGKQLQLLDGKQFLNLDEEYISASEIWNATLSFQVNSGCIFTACNDSNLDGDCKKFSESAPTLPLSFASLLSANCTCATDCQCSSIYMRRSGCARAYINGDCNTCHAHYTDLRGQKESFSPEFQGKVSSIVIRPGCSLTIYDEEDYEGDDKTYQDTVENWNKNKEIGSYECHCIPESLQLQSKPPRPAEYPDFINLPNTVDDISKMMNGEAGRHPGLLAALKSLKNKRSARNAYILILGLTGSGKSSAVS